jgi:D-glycero-D-manno-heptose 1,7-bisphosphate phosphatase
VTIQSRMQPAVFLDRDGTLIEEVGYLNRLDRVKFFPWTVDAIRVLNDAGLLVVVVTNQAGVAQGYYDEAFVRRTHRHIDERLRAGRALVAGYYYCPHHPKASVEAYRQVCECRKPSPGMIRQAARELGIDATRSYVVGDRWGDIDLGAAAGVKSVLLRTGYGQADDARPPGAAVPDHISDNLAGAAGWIIRDWRSVSDR